MINAFSHRILKNSLMPTAMAQTAKYAMIHHTLISPW